LAPVLPIYHYKHIIESGGIEIRGLETVSTNWSEKPPANHKYEQYIFVPYEYELNLDETPSKRQRDILTVLLQIICENVTTLDIKVVEIAGERAEESLLAPLVLTILQGEPYITVSKPLDFNK
jgi:hypothetical protein